MAAQAHFDRLIESVELLAADFDIQRKAFPPFVHVPDKVTLTFEGAMAVIDQICFAGLLTSEQIALFTKINALLAMMSGSEHESFWTPDTMKHDPTWNKVRTLARKTLDSLGRQVREPNLGWMQYVPSRGEG